MPEATASAYFDSSALVKLFAHEPESDALVDAAGAWPIRASSELALAEVLRAAGGHPPEVSELARGVLDDTALHPVDRSILELAARLLPRALRALDAIHLATALSLDPVPAAFVSYDARLNEAARAAGLRVASPGTA